MGKPRVIAETGAGQHGVASGHRLRAARARVRGLHGHRGHAPPAAERGAHGAAGRRGGAGRGRRADAQGGGLSEAIRDWVANVETTHYVIGSAVGPAPYPALVRDLQRVIGDEARAQVLEAAGRLPDRVIACVGGGSNAIGTFTAVRRRRRRGADRRRGRRARGSTRGATARRSPPAPAASCTARCRPCSRTRRARSSRRTRSPPGSTTRASGPEHAQLRDTGRVRYVAVTDEDALAAFKHVARLEGILPALEPAHAIAWLLANPDAGARRWSRSRGGATRTWPRCSGSSARRPGSTASRPRSRATASGRR